MMSPQILLGSFLNTLSRLSWRKTVYEKAWLWTNPIVNYLLKVKNKYTKTASICLYTFYFRHRYYKCFRDDISGTGISRPPEGTGTLCFKSELKVPFSSVWKPALPMLIMFQKGDEIDDLALRNRNIYCAPNHGRGSDNVLLNLIYVCCFFFTLVLSLRTLVQQPCIFPMEHQTRSKLHFCS